MKTQRYKVKWLRYPLREITPLMKKVDGKGYWMQWEREYKILNVIDVTQYVVVDHHWPDGLSKIVHGNDVTLVQDDNTRHRFKCKVCKGVKSINRFSERSRTCRPCLAKQRKEERL